MQHPLSDYPIIKRILITVSSVLSTLHFLTASGTIKQSLWRLYFRHDFYSHLVHHEHLLSYTEWFVERWINTSFKFMLLPPLNVLNIKSHSFIKASPNIMRLSQYNSTKSEGN